MKKYKVRPMQDSTYEVWEQEVNNTGSSFENPFDSEVKVFQGSISDCEAWIRLKENGNL